MRKHKVSFGDMGMYGGDISDEMNQILDESWRQAYGLEITDVALTDINLTDESMERVSRIDDATIFLNPNLQSGLMAQASAEALTTAAGNTAGSMVGFMGMNMANQAGVNMMGAVNQNVNGVNQQSVNNQPEPGTIFARPEQEIQQPVTPEQPTVETTRPKFCPNCGTKTEGTKFCSNCGQQLN